MTNTKDHISKHQKSIFNTSLAYKQINTIMDIQKMEKMCFSINHTVSNLKIILVERIKIYDKCFAKTGMYKKSHKSWYSVLVVG